MTKCARGYKLKEGKCVRVKRKLLELKGKKKWVHLGFLVGAILGIILFVPALIFSWFGWFFNWFSFAGAIFKPILSVLVAIIVLGLIGAFAGWVLKKLFKF